MAVSTLLAASAFAESRPSRETQWRDGNRGRSSRDGSYDNRRGNDSRNGGRYESRQQQQQPYRASGRVSRVDRYGSGYRVWVGGSRYPFFVPDRYYRRDRFRVGVFIELGGYYNPGGYYDYYDGGSSYSRGDLRGVVESVDYRRGTFVIRNEASGSFVTVATRDRYREDVRAGDYVELTGDWTRNGLFEARRVDIVDSRGYNDGYRR
ncbi:MAG TPA: hypothetical protein VJZ00_15685 [Thermoanaerobaculia bacterium]|nr:hypothetical protein [Thermoanaerobaculia bacterium]